MSVVDRLSRDVRARAGEARQRIDDWVGVALGRRDRLRPPDRLQNVGEGHFGAVGEEFVHYLHALADLKASDRVLDVGCGIGRVARVLARELRTAGSYDGFDIVRPSVEWCQQHYRGTAAPFRFVHADIRNTLYNPTGQFDAAEYVFPYPPGSFDLAIAISVFTHLVPASAERYISEASRVLAPGGRMLLTWFLLNDLPIRNADFDFQPTAGPAQSSTLTTPRRRLPIRKHGSTSSWRAPG